MTPEQIAARARAIAIRELKKQHGTHDSAADAVYEQVKADVRQELRERGNRKMHGATPFSDQRSMPKP